MVESILLYIGLGIFIFNGVVITFKALFEHRDRNHNGHIDKDEKKLTKEEMAWATGLILNNLSIMASEIQNNLKCSLPKAQDVLLSNLKHIKEKDIKSNENSNTTDVERG